MSYPKLPNIGALQRKNANRIRLVVNKATKDTPQARGLDLQNDSPIEQICWDWCNSAVEELKKSLLEKKFNQAGNLYAGIAPNVIDRAGLLKVLQIQMPDEWYWAEHGRRKGKRPPIQPLEEWITGRGIDVKKVKSWESKVTDKKGNIHLVKPYKNINDTLKLRHIMAEAISRSIGRHGTIKGTNSEGNRGWSGYTGSKFFSEVINHTSLDLLAKSLSEAVGYTIGIRIADSI